VDKERRSTLKEKVLDCLKRIEKTCCVLQEEKTLQENRLLAVRLGLDSIGCLSKMALEEIQKGTEQEKEGH